MKVTVIGAGSSYTPELIEGFIDRYNNVPISELHLVDCPEGETKLNIIFDLTKRMLTKADLPIKIYKHLDYKEAIKGSDFVMCQIRVGFLEARALDERIPGKYGMLGQETNGAGGLFKAIRTIPVIFDIVDEVKKSAPNAWIINFSNPSGMIAEAVHRFKKFDKFIGLCNVPIGMEKHFQTLIDEPKAKYDFMGLNHFVFMTKTSVDNYNITDKVIDAVIKTTDNSVVKNISEEKWQPEFLKQLGSVPCSYLQYYYKKEYTLNKFLKEWETGTTRAEEVMKLEKELFKKYQDVNLDVKPVELEQRGGAFYSTAACSLVESIVTNDGATHVINYKNNGAIAELPNDVVCEYSAKIIDGKVLHDLRSHNLPFLIVGDVLKMKYYEVAVVNGIKNNSYNEILGALMINPLTTDDHKAEQIFSELFDAHKKYINFERPTEDRPNINQNFDHLEYIEGLNIPVLMYHRFTTDESKTDQFTCTVDQFERELQTIAELGYSYVTLDNLFDYLNDKKPIPENSVMLTFDDGNKEMETLILPLLQKYNALAVMFIVGGKLGITDTNKNRKYVNEYQLENLRKSNLVELSHHTFNFHDKELDNVIIKKTDDQVLNDEYSNRPYLNKPEHFCFPYGLYNENVLNLLKSAGIKMAFTVKTGYANQKNDLMQIERIEVSPATTNEQFKTILKGEYNG